MIAMKHTHILPLAAVFACALAPCVLAGDMPNANPSNKNPAADIVRPLPPASVLLRGRLGDSLRLSIGNRLKKVDYAHPGQ